MSVPMPEDCRDLDDWSTTYVKMKKYEGKGYRYAKMVELSEYDKEIRSYMLWIVKTYGKDLKVPNESQAIDFARFLTAPGPSEYWSWLAGQTAASPGSVAKPVVTWKSCFLKILHHDAPKDATSVAILPTDQDRPKVPDPSRSAFPQYCSVSRLYDESKQLHQPARSRQRLHEAMKRIESEDEEV
eukprot:s381_g4.t1